jgi:coenzyme F420-reducing hydrogenase delta subunit
MEGQTPEVSPPVGPTARSGGFFPNAKATAFVCANGARPGMVPSSTGNERPSRLPVEWPFHVDEIMVPCTGKLQPEHLLKAFESGADLVCVVACAHDNCHYVQGCRRAERRVDYVRGVLDEIGLSGQRLLLFRVPGSGREDMALGCGESRPGVDPGREALEQQLVAICERLATRLISLGTSPLNRNGDLT